MTSKFGDVLYIDTSHRPEAGSFARAKDLVGNRYKVVQWYYCRELFHGQLYNLPLFFFSHDSRKGNHVAAFMRKVEDTLGVEPRSDFGPTQRKTIMWVEPSRWWTMRAMRRSLFTILLRAGTSYIPSRDNFQEALHSDPYSIATRYAVERFLAGHTVYKGKKRGWLRQFYDEKPTHAEIDALLVKPF
jgi:hypothetical protein